MVPGPGHYEQPSFMSRGQKAIIGQSLNSLKNKDGLPGPGQYNPNDSSVMKHHGAIKFNERNEPKDYSTFIGPQKHNTQDHPEKGLKFSFGLETRMRDIKNEMPCVG